MRRLLSILLLLFITASTQAQQNLDVTLMPNIQGIKLFIQGNQLGYPIINVNTPESLELHFDDMDGRVKNYYYTFQLCDADWSTVNLSTFDYIKGFSQVRLNQYRISSNAYAKYIHYQAVLPDRNCVPSTSGNFLLKVYLDGDTNKLAFTRRILVVGKQAELGIQLLQPFNPEVFKTHQKVQFIVNQGQLNIANPLQQVKAVVLQNYRWDNAKMNIPPTFIRNNTLEFNSENTLVFPSGKEYRWADLRSFRFQSERVARAEYNKVNSEIFLQLDGDRTQQRYLNYRDYNGFFFIESTDVSNVWWQGDYANVHFTFVPPGNQPYANKKVFVVGEMNEYNTNDTAAMTFNTAKGVYEKTLYLKQAYYTYEYVTKDANNPLASASTELTEGNYWETENDYTVLIYYRSLAGRHDELIAVSSINSLSSRNNRF